MLPVLHLDPAIEPAAAVAVLADQALQPHPAGMPEQIGTDPALLEWRRVDAVRPPCRNLARLVMRIDSGNFRRSSPSATRQSKA
jgi:hypothetical protein